MKIAYVTETWHPSVDGVVTRLRATMECLSQLGHQALVVAPEPPGRNVRSGTTTGAGSDRPAPYEVLRLPSVSPPHVAGGRPFGIPMRNRVRSRIEEFGADLVHVVNPFLMARAGIAAAEQLRLPLVASFHQDLAMVARHMRLGFLDKIIWGYTRRRYATAKTTLATSQAMMDLLGQHGIGRVALWPCGVDRDRFDPGRRSLTVRHGLTGGQPGRLLALYAGRLAPEKGLHGLYPLARDPNVVLVVAGDGPERPGMERDLAGCSVCFTGWLSQEDLADVYASCDVFVFPSVTETLGFGLVEALAAGLPVLAADSPPTREILGEGGAGAVLPVADWQSRVVAATRWIGGPERATASRNAREHAAQWDWSQATDRLVEIYRSVTRPELALE